MLAEQNDEVPAQEVGLVLDRGAAACRHQHVEQLAVARLLARGGVLVQRVQYLVDDARDRALREERPRGLHERRVSGQWRPDVHDAVREDLPGELTGGTRRVAMDSVRGCLLLALAATFIPR